MASLYNPRLERDNAMFPFDVLLHVERWPIVWLAIPKSGCSTIKRWMIAHTDPVAAKDPSLDVHRFAHERLALHRLSASDRGALARLPIVTFVRPPADRLRSAFVEKFVRPDPSSLFEPACELLNALGLSRERGVTFREFVRHVVSTEPMQLDSHWRPQVAFLSAAKPTLILQITDMTPVLRSLSDGEAVLAASEPTNVTRKEALRSGCVADVPSAELHGLNLRPVPEDFFDDALCADIAEFDGVQTSGVSDAVAAIKALIGRRGD